MEKSDTPAAPSLFSVLPASLFLMITGWAGLGLLLVYSQPTVWPQWLFFFLLVLAVTGTVMPVVAVFNLRFQSGQQSTYGVITRQSLWFGIYVAALAWLRIPRVLTPILALLLGFGLILIEWLLRVREQVQWRPK